MELDLLLSNLFWICWLMKYYKFLIKYNLPSMCQTFLLEFSNSIYICWVLYFSKQSLFCKNTCRKYLKQKDQDMQVENARNQKKNKNTANKKSEKRVKIWTIFYLLFNLSCFIESLSFLNMVDNVNDVGKYSGISDGHRTLA